VLCPLLGCAGAVQEPTLTERRVAEVVAETTANKGEGLVWETMSVERVDSPAARELFPGWSFHRLLFRMRVTDPEKTKHMSLPAFLDLTLAVGEDGSTLRLYRAGDHKEFGAFLAQEGIVVEEEADARRVLSALFELVGTGGMDDSVAHVAPGEWHLGSFSSEDTVSTTEVSREVELRSYYLRLLTDHETQRVLSLELILVRGEPRVEPKD
jgi:hypothetical protein